MADRHLKEIFREAAEIARSVPPEFRQSAFEKAVDLLSDSSGYVPPVRDAGGRATRVSVTGIPVSDALIDKSVEALSYAANCLGLEAVTADQLATILNDNFGMPAPATLVANALTRAGTAVRTARQGQKTLYRMVTPRKPRRSAEAVEVEVETASAKRKRAKAQASTPADVVNDLIALGFFATARTTADVLLYLEKQGLDFTTRQLAPVLVAMMRRGQLRREAGADGPYRYRAKR